MQKMYTLIVEKKKDHEMAGLGILIDEKLSLSSITFNK